MNRFPIVNQSSTMPLDARLPLDLLSAQETTATAPDGGQLLLSRLLQEQGQFDVRPITAVEAFSEEHDRGKGLSSRVESYRQLMPASPPGPGQQYAFEVDLDSCSGCKACVTACHALNGLDEHETWRDVGLLVGGSRTLPVLQHVTAACHHCVEPACLIGCPVNAYEKDPITGIVKHLDDQCFGCQYCTLACPYEVPKYHAAKGIVRKCDMCSSRLALGEAPACVQACPHHAITIKTVDVQQVIEDAESAVFLPAAPDPHITFPSTTYKSKKPFPRNLLPADYYRVHTQHAHWPLVIMLVLTQLSVGAFVVGILLDVLLEPQYSAALRPMLAANALGFGLLALSASVLHLGRPRYAYRAVLGLRHSWLSREIVAFGIFAGLASAYAAAIWLTSQGSDLHGALDHLEYPVWVRWLGWSVAVSGAAGVCCSVMIYVFTQRECWSWTRVFVKFTLTAALLGVAAVWLTILCLTLVCPSPELSELVHFYGPELCMSILAVMAVKLGTEAAIFRYLLFRRMSPLKRSALLLTGELSNFTLARFAVGILGGLVMPCLLWNSLRSDHGTDLVQFVISSSFLIVFCVAGELFERALFFTACAAPRMPGSIR